jgi:hypothetical protein
MPVNAQMNSTESMEIVKNVQLEPAMILHQKLAF